jgi:hypothetical protein
LLAHLTQLELHASPYTTKIDGHDSVKILSGSISGLRDNILNAGVIVGSIQLAESGDSLLNHCFYLRVVSNVAMNGDRFVTLVGEFCRCGTHRLLIPIC